MKIKMPQILLLTEYALLDDIASTRFRDGYWHAMRTHGAIHVDRIIIPTNIEKRSIVDLDSAVADAMRSFDRGLAGIDEGG
jgi:hypothetical protein